MKTKTKICDFPNLSVGCHVAFRNGMVKGKWFGRVMEQRKDGMILVGIIEDVESYDIINATWQPEGNLAMVGAFSENLVDRAKDMARE